MESVASVRQAVRSYWPLGIQEQHLGDGFQEIKFRGNPWFASGQDAVYSRRVVCQILAALFNDGWMMSISTDISKFQMDLDTMLFREQTPAPPRCEWACIWFGDRNEVRFIDAPADLVQGMVREMDPLLHSHGQHRVHGCHEFKFKGYPFHSDSMDGRKILLGLLSVLDTQGWSVYATVDQKARGATSASDDTDTWHCCRSLTWTPGMPVYHR